VLVPLYKKIPIRENQSGYLNVLPITTGCRVGNKERLLATLTLQFNSGTFFFNIASLGRIFLLNKNKGNKKQEGKAEDVKEDTKARIYQLIIQFGRKANTRLSALTFFVK
jgi:hypothetical protein